MYDPDLYERTNIVTKPDARYALERFVPHMRWSPNELALDVGCGPGDVTVDELLARLPSDCHLVGGDVSNAMVKYAAMQYRTVDRVSFQHMDITNTANHDRSYSKVFSFFCLHWVQDQRRALENIHRLLENDGETLLVFIASGRVFETHERMAALPTWRKYMKDAKTFISPYQHVADPCKQFSGLMSDVGFEVLHCSCTENTFMYESLSHIRDFLRSVNPFLSRIPPEMHDSYMDDYVYQYYKPEIIHDMKMPSEISVDDIQGGSFFVHNVLVAHAKKLN